MERGPAGGGRDYGDELCGMGGVGRWEGTLMIVDLRCLGVRSADGIGLIGYSDLLPLPERGVFYGEVGGDLGGAGWG